MKNFTLINPSITQYNIGRRIRKIAAVPDRLILNKSGKELPSFYIDLSIFNESQKVRERISAIQVHNEIVSRRKEKVDRMLNELRDKITDFCKKEPQIHSAWVHLDNKKNELKIFTVLKNNNFDTEFRAFNNLYADLPVKLDEVYIDPRVVVLGRKKIKSIIPTDCVQYF
jgi:hypothetical protein